MRRAQIEILEEAARSIRDPSVRPEPRRDPLDAVQGRGPRLRYFPTPPVAAGARSDWIKAIEASLPSCGRQEARLQSQYGLSAYDRRADHQTARADLFETVAEAMTPS